MARTDGIGRGLLHGTLIGAAALAVLSLAVPLRQTAPQTEGDVDIAGRAAPVPEALTAASPDPVTKPAMPGDSPEAEGPPPASAPAANPALETQMGPPTGSEFARAEDLPPTLPGSSTAPATVAAVAEVAEPAAETLPQPTTGPAGRPDAQNETETPRAGDEAQTAVAAPQAETAQPVTQPNPVRIGQPGQDAGLEPASRAAPQAPDQAEETALPAAETRPTTTLAQRPDAPGDAVSPASATMAAAPADLPDAQTGTQSTANAAADDGQAPATAAGASSEIGARPSAPVLQAPDPRRETVPPPPPAATQDAPSSGSAAAIPAGDDGGVSGAIQDRDPVPVDAGAAPASAVTDPAPAATLQGDTAPSPDDQAAPAAADTSVTAPMNGRPAPDLDIPALPLTSMP